MDFPARLKQKGGVSLPSRVDPFIYELPPSSKFTRKHQPVDLADVMWNVRPGGAGSDPTRINENIRQYARGINPSVEVSYSNFGLSSQGGATKAVGNPYKIEVVRPPLFPVETTHSISNPRTHQTISVETNPGLSPGYATNTLAYDFDTWDTVNTMNANKASGPGTIQTSLHYLLQTPTEMSASHAINDNRPDPYEMSTNPGKPIDVSDFVCREQTPYGIIVRPNYSVTSNVKFHTIEDMNGDASSKVRKEVLLQNIRPNFQVVVYDPVNHISTEVQANIKQKNWIAVQAAIGQPISLNRDDGTAIKLNNYQWTAVQTNVGTDQLILSVEQPDMILERNLPLYATATSLVAPTDINERRNYEYEMEGKMGALPDPTINLAAYYDGNNAHGYQGADFHTKERTMNLSFDNQGTSRPLQFQRELPQLRDISRLQRAAQQEYNRTFD